MDKKITKSEMQNILATAVASEMNEFIEKTGGGYASLAIALMGASITHKVLEALFEDDSDTIEITEKE